VIDLNSILVEFVHSDMTTVEGMTGGPDNFVGVAKRQEVDRNRLAGCNELMKKRLIHDIKGHAHFMI